MIWVPQGIGGQCPRASYWSSCISFQQLLLHLLSLLYLKKRIRSNFRLIWCWSLATTTHCEVPKVQGLPFNTSAYHSNTCSCGPSEDWIKFPLLPRRPLPKGFLSMLLPIIPSLSLQLLVLKRNIAINALIDKPECVKNIFKAEQPASSPCMVQQFRKI